MITKDYSKGPRVVRKDYVLWKIQNMKESASMPSFCMWPISVFNQEPCGFEIETKELCFWTIPIAFENILEGTYLHTGFENNCFCSGVVHKLCNRFQALTVRANDYV